MHEYNDEERAQFKNRDYAYKWVARGGHCGAACADGSFPSSLDHHQRFSFYVDNWKVCLTTLLLEAGLTTAEQMMDAGWPLFVRGSPESEAGTANALRILEKLVGCGETTCDDLVGADGFVDWDRCPTRRSGRP